MVSADVQDARDRVARLDQNIVAQHERLRKIRRAGNDPVLAEMILATLERSRCSAATILAQRVAAASA